jgi:hypothetical protein
MIIISPEKLATELERRKYGKQQNLMIEILLLLQNFWVGRIYWISKVLRGVQELNGKSYNLQG